MDEGLSIHTNAAMDFPLGHDDAGAGEGSRPRDYMIVNGFEEGTIQVEQDCGIVRFPGFPRGRHLVTGQSICESRFGCDWRRVWVKKMVDTTVVTEEARQPRRGQVHRTGGAKGLCTRARRPLLRYSTESLQYRRKLHGTIVTGKEHHDESCYWSISFGEGCENVRASSCAQLACMKSGCRWP